MPITWEALSKRGQKELARILDPLHVQYLRENSLPFNNAIEAIRELEGECRTRYEHDPKEWIRWADRCEELADDYHRVIVYRLAGGDSVGATMRGVKGLPPALDELNRTLPDQPECYLPRLKLGVCNWFAAKVVIGGPVRSVTIPLIETLPARLAVLAPDHAARTRRRVVLEARTLVADDNPERGKYRPKRRHPEKPQVSNELAKDLGRAVNLSPSRAAAILKDAIELGEFELPLDIGTSLRKE